MKAVTRGVIGRCIRAQVLVAVWLMVQPVAHARAQCFGDCNNDAVVSAGDLTKIIALILYCPCSGSLPGGAAAGCAALPAPDAHCISADRDGDGCVQAGELTRVISDMLSFPDGCPPTASPTVTAPSSPTFAPSIAAPTNTPINTFTATPSNTVTPTNTPLDTPTFTRTPSPASSSTATPTSTPAPHAAICGNGVVDPGEDCDDGGICIGTSNAGTPCTSESDCTGLGGVCVDGPNDGTFCTDDTGCSGGRCVKCKTFGGDGCAANCTAEIAVRANFVPGSPPLNSTQGSLAKVLSEAIPGVSVPLSATQTLAIGRKVNNQIPVVIPAASVVFQPVPISILACACGRAVSAKTCGGTLLEANGMTSPDCTLEDNCAALGKNPCTFVHGPGNAGSGVIGCAALDGINITYTQDAGGAAPPPPPTPPPGSALPVITSSGTGGPGSARIPFTLQIGVVTLVPAAPGQTQPCSVPTPGQRAGEYGADGKFCTADDPVPYRGVPHTLPAVTGTATAEILNHYVVATGKTTNVGPAPAIGGHPFSCSALTGVSPSVTGVALAGAFTELNQPSPIGDVVVTFVLNLQ